MKKELSPAVTISIIVVAVLVIVGAAYTALRPPPATRPASDPMFTHRPKGPMTAAGGHSAQ